MNALLCGQPVLLCTRTFPEVGTLHNQDLYHVVQWILSLKDQHAQETSRQPHARLRGKQQFSSLVVEEHWTSFLNSEPYLSSQQT